METENERRLKSENETLRRENAELRETLRLLRLGEAVASPGSPPASAPPHIPLPRRPTPSNTKSEESLETAYSSNYSEVLLRQCQQQLANVQEQLTILQQVTAATQRRELIQEGVYENLPPDSVYEQLRFDPTYKHIYERLPTHTGLNLGLDRLFYTTAVKVSDTPGAGNRHFTNYKR